MALVLAPCFTARVHFIVYFYYYLLTQISHDKANALFHKQSCGGQDGNVLYNAIEFMFQVQGLGEESVSKDQTLKVYPFCLFACSFKVCWVIPSIHLYFVL